LLLQAPIYSALELSDALLKEAKEQGKARIAFAFLEGMGEGWSVKKEGSWTEGTGRERPGRRAYKWVELRALLELVKSLDNLGLAAGQLRSIAASSGSARLKAEVLIKYQVGRRVISPEDGTKLLGYNDSGALADAFTIRSRFREGRNV
jgi:hypothetical protein